jgi:hypothetical protein
MAHSFVHYDNTVHFRQFSFCARVVMPRSQRKAIPSPVSNLHHGLRIACWRRPKESDGLGVRREIGAAVHCRPARFLRLLPVGVVLGVEARALGHGMWHILPTFSLCAPENEIPCVRVDLLRARGVHRSHLIRNQEGPVAHWVAVPVPDQLTFPGSPR